MQKRGFTLIEIVIVMAIAGLIVILVFLAIFGAQRARRDNQRRHDLGRLAGQLEIYAGANTGKYPTPSGGPGGFTSDFETSYLPDSFQDPLAHSAYDMEIGVATPCDPTAPPASPNGPGSVGYDTPGTGGNPYKLRMCLEKGEYDIGF